MKDIYRFLIVVVLLFLAVGVAAGTPSLPDLMSVPVANAQSAPTFSKSFSPGTIGPGSVSTLQFDITNPDLENPVTDLAFTDNLPADVTIAAPANATSTCGGTLSAPDGGSTISLSDGEVETGTTCSITVDVTSSTPGTHTNVSGDLMSSAGNSGGATADLTVATDRPGFSKSFSPSTISLGGKSTLTFTIDNTANGSGAIFLAFTDNLPVGLEVAGPANVSNTCTFSSFTGGVVTAVPGTSVVSLGSGGGLDVGAVAAGASCTVTVDVVATGVGQLGNTSGELTSTPQSGGSPRSSGKASASLEVNAGTISLTKSFVDDPVIPGGTVTLGFEIRNLSRLHEATNIGFTDDLNAMSLAGLTVSSLPAPGFCGAGSTLTESSGVLTMSGGQLEADPQGPGGPGANASCTFSVTLDVPSGASSGSYTNTTSQITADVNGEPVTGASATDDLFVVPAPVLTKEFTDDPVSAGGTVTLEFTITNPSPAQMTDIAFQDVFDAILPSAVSTPANGFCGPDSTAIFTPPTQFTAATLVVSSAELGPGASCTFDVTLNVASDAPNGAYPNTTSAVTAVVGGADVEGDPATDNLLVIAPPALSKAFIDDPVAPGGTVTLGFRLTHSPNAPADATNVAFTDDLDAVLSGLTATGLPLNDICGTGSQLSGTSTLSFSGGTLAPGDVCEFSVTLSVPASAASGSHTNTTSNVTATVAGTPVTGSQAEADLRIAALSLTKEFTDDPVAPGDPVTLEFTIENASPTQSAADISFTDDLGNVLSGLTTTDVPQNDVCGTGSSLTLVGDTLVFQGGSLSSGTSCTFDVTLDVPAGATPDTYGNLTSGFSATIGGSTVSLANATDKLIVEDPTPSIVLAKSFSDDPVAPGEQVTLKFGIGYTGPSDATNIAFTDDLSAVLAGLEATGLPANDVCGAGSQLTGTDVLTLTGGTLAPDGFCTFNVTLQVPLDASQGSFANATSNVTADVGGSTITGNSATDSLDVVGNPPELTLTKLFGRTPVLPGDLVTLTFTLDYVGTITATDVVFTDDLGAAMLGLEVIGLPANDVCGTGSQLTGTDVLTLTGGTLIRDSSCVFETLLQVPATVPNGVYTNTTSTVTALVGGQQLAGDPATDVLSLVTPLTVDNLSVTVDEGQTATNSGTYNEPDGVTFTLDAVPGSVVKNADGTWDWSFLTTDGPAESGPVVISADGVTVTAEISFTLTVNNVAPSVAADNATVTVDEGQTATNTGTFSDPGADTVSLTASVGTVTDTGGGTWSWSFDTSDGPDDSQTVTITATDSDSASTSTTFALTVNNVAPSVAADNATVTVDEGQTATNTGTFSDPGADTVSLTASVGTVTDTGGGTWSWSFDTSDGPDDSQTVTITATDSDGASTSTSFDLTVNNVPPTVGPLTAPVAPVDINAQPITATATFTDPGTLDTHTAVWDWGDTTTTTQNNVSPAVSATHTYTQPGVYRLTLTLTDDDGGVGTEAFEFVVIYDPAGGFVTGGGWIDSPAGAYPADPDLTGKANFGFVSKYKKGSSVPTGNTQFKFKAADFNFRSTSYEWMVIAGSHAKYKGEGQVNNQGVYGFMLTACDVQVNGNCQGEDEDTFRIKIWDKANNDEVVYDNKIGESDNSNAGTALGGGNIKIHSGGNGGGNGAIVR